jgi:hypothetical protein
MAAAEALLGPVYDWVSAARPQAVPLRTRWLARRRRMAGRAAMRRTASQRLSGSPRGVLMFVDGKWISIPPDTIQYRSLAGDSGTTGGGIGAARRLGVLTEVVIFTA